MVNQDAIKPVLDAAEAWRATRDVYCPSAKLQAARDEADVDLEVALIKAHYMGPNDAITKITPGIARLYVNFESGLELQIPTGKR